MHDTYYNFLVERHGCFAHTRWFEQYDQQIGFYLFLKDLIITKHAAGGYHISCAIIAATVSVAKHKSYCSHYFSVHDKISIDPSRRSILFPIVLRVAHSATSRSTIGNKIDLLRANGNFVVY